MATIPLKPSNSTYTDGQWQAIYDQGHNILVSASAGSGKTTVLVERVIQKLKAGEQLDQLLIVTYTEAAAKEMKARIEKALQQELNQTLGSEKQQHFIRQMSLLPTATISTLHAFCLQVIRRYAYLIELDPVFRLLTDETEIELLKEDVWDALREEEYGKENPLFFQLAGNFSNDRSDRGLTATLYALYEFSRANPDPQQWLQSLQASYDWQADLAEHPLYRECLLPDFQQQARQLVEKTQLMVQAAEGDPDLAKCLDLARHELQAYSEIKRSFHEDPLATTYSKIQEMQFERFPTVKKSAPDEVKEVGKRIKQWRDENKKTLEKWRKGFFAVAPDEHVQRLAEAQPLVVELARLTQTFTERYRAAKAERRVLDFNDLEHYTLAILQQESGEASEASLYYREKFKEVLVDEYQDINRLQEAILAGVRQSEEEAGNLFMVGDVKQSIYAFRLADPTLFIDKYEAFGHHQGGERIILAENFRSRKNVLDFTNFIFEQIMDKEVGQLDYDEAAHLQNGFTGYPPHDQVATEILIYENAQIDQEEADSDSRFEDKTEGEIHLIGLKIREMMDQKFPVYDKKQGTMRPLTYQDIVLLTPTKKNNLVLLEVFKKLGIPLAVNDAQNYFQATEIKLMVSFLEIIDNPYQDIPLASVLRSPIVGLNENELAQIRALAPQTSFYQAVEKSVENEHLPTAIRQKLVDFLAYLDRLRANVQQQPLAELIWQIYQETGLLDYVGGLPAGAQRQANLHALYERASAYEKTSFKGLFQFIRFIEKMQSKGKDLAEPTVLGNERDAVRVMTIHASKGLEFPVVFVLDLTKKFNLMDLMGRAIYDERMGLGIQYLDEDQRVLHPTLPFYAIREVKRKKILAEEMRKLYVALTRAEEKLFLVGSYKDQAALAKEWSQAAFSEEQLLSADVRLGSTSLMKWIGLSLIRHPLCQLAEQTVELPRVAAVEQQPVTFTLSFLDERHVQQQLSDLKPMTTQTQEQRGVDIDLAAELPQWIRRMEQNYAFSLASQTTSYQSVSEIKRVFEDPDNHELLAYDFEQRKNPAGQRFTEDTLAMPQFLTQQAPLSAAEVGTATHVFLQQFPLTDIPTEENVRQFAQNLVEKRVIPEAAFAVLPYPKITAFLTSSFGEYLREHAQEVAREQPFSLLLPPERLFEGYQSASGDDVLIHGIIDGYIETESDCILYDFKTDELLRKNPRQTPEQMVQKYRGQLYLYKLALEAAKGRPVTAVKLIWLTTNQIIDIPL